MAVEFMNAAELTSILQVLVPERTMDDIVFTELMRPRAIGQQIILVEQRDSFYNYTPARVAGTSFSQLNRESKGRFTLEAVQYGEDKPMDEKFMLMSRQMGTFGTPVDLTEEQMNDQLNLIDRMITRLKKITWDLFTTGTYKALGANGELIGTDSYNFGQLTAAVDWSNWASATPLADMRNWKLQHRGSSVFFDNRAKLFMQSTDVNNMLNNQNQTDLGARLKFIPGYGTRTLNLADVNSIFLAMDLPQVVEYDESYNTQAVNFNTSFPLATGGGPFPYTMFIPAGTAVLIGARRYGDPVCDYTMTPTLPQALGMSGIPTGVTESDSPWSNIYMDFDIDLKDKWAARSRIAFAGAPRVLFPSAIYKVNLQP